MQSNEENDEKVFVIEMHADTHFFTPDELAKYQNYYNKRKSPRSLVSNNALRLRQGQGMTLTLHFWNSPYLFRSLVLLFLHLWPVADAIVGTVAGAVCMKNEIPKS